MGHTFNPFTLVWTLKTKGFKVLAQFFSTPILLEVEAADLTDG
jgi:hypothetical protein